MTATFAPPAPGVLEEMSAEDVVRLLVESFARGRVALACSFQKEESVLVDMLLRADPGARIFTLDTHLLFPETYAVWRQVEERYGIEVAVYQGPSLGRQAAVHGDALWERNPDLCCSLRKVAPLHEALAGLDAWITGMRRDQAATRTDTEKIGWDERYELWKASPLADWDDARVLGYVAEHDVPVNALHAQGFASIGCVPCTSPGEGREGRWAGHGKTECGLHCSATGGRRA